MQSRSFINFEHTVLTSVDTDYAITNKLTPFVSMQNQYNLLYREDEREMLPTLKVSWPVLFTLPADLKRVLV